MVFNGSPCQTPSSGSCVPGLAFNVSRQCQVLIKKLLDRFRQPREDDVFVTFMQVALENDDIRQQVLQILSLPRAERINTIRGWIRDLEAEGAPETLITALSYLENENLADRARELLHIE